jgi:hypothetical protein
MWYEKCVGVGWGEVVVSRVRGGKKRKRKGKEWVYIRMRLHVTRTSDAPSSFSGRLWAIEVLSENWV